MLCDKTASNLVIILYLKFKLKESQLPMKSKLPLFLIPILLSLLFIGTAYYINTHIIYPATTIYDWLDTVYLYHLANRLCILAILILLLQALYFSFKKKQEFFTFLWKSADLSKSSHSRNHYTILRRSTMDDQKISIIILTRNNTYMPQIRIEN